MAWLVLPAAPAAAPPARARSGRRTRRPRPAAWPACRGGPGRGRRRAGPASSGRRQAPWPRRPRRRAPGRPGRPAPGALAASYGASSSRHDRQAPRRTATAAPASPSASSTDPRAWSVAASRPGSCKVGDPARSAAASRRRRRRRWRAGSRPRRGAAAPASGAPVSPSTRRMAALAAPVRPWASRRSQPGLRLVAPSAGQPVASSAASNWPRTRWASACW